MKTLLRVHEDIHTVPEAIGKMAEEYAAEGYQVERLSSMNFKIVLQGGWVHIFWEDGRIWQEIIEEKEEKEILVDHGQEKELIKDIDEHIKEAGGAYGLELPDSDLLVIRAALKYKVETFERMAIFEPEDKEMICHLLCKTLQKTRGCADLRSLNFDHEDEIVTAIFESRSQKINVACDSGTAMIRDIVNHLRC